eukprot:scaffold764_cov408-Prasinococcus_capsulatus_cf.AAC.19
MFPLPRRTKQQRPPSGAARRLPVDVCRVRQPPSVPVDAPPPDRLAHVTPPGASAPAPSAGLGSLP